jgi:hypothetical protein
MAALDLYRALRIQPSDGINPCNNSAQRGRRNKEGLSPQKQSAKLFFEPWQLAEYQKKAKDHADDGLRADDKNSSPPVYASRDCETTPA